MSFKYKGKRNEYIREIEEDLNDTKRKAAFLTFKQNLEDIWRSDFEDDVYLFKWFKGRDFDAEKAEKMLRDHLEWRFLYKTDYLLLEFKIPEVVKRYCPGGFCGFDKQLRPVWYEPIGNADPDGLQRSATMEDLVRSRVYLWEYVQFRMGPSLREKTGYPIYQTNVVYDYNNLNKKALFSGVDFFINLIKICTLNYPEAVACFYIINAPAVFYVGYNLVKPFLNSNIQNKIKILGSNFRQELQEVIDKDQVPAIYGGTKTDPDGDPRCRNWICQGGPVPSEYFLQPNHSNMSVVTIGRKSFFKIPIEVTQKNSYIEWEVVSNEGDIGIDVYLENEVKGQPKLFIEQRKEDCGMVPRCGYVKCANIGSYIVKLDNSYSWVKSKTIRYYVGINLKRPKNYEPIYKAQTLNENSKSIIPQFFRDIDEAEKNGDIEDISKVEATAAAECYSLNHTKRKRCDEESIDSYHTAVSHLS